MTAPPIVVDENYLDEIVIETRMPDPELAKRFIKEMANDLSYRYGVTQMGGSGYASGIECILPHERMHHFRGDKFDRHGNPIHVKLSLVWASREPQVGLLANSPQILVRDLEEYVLWDALQRRMSEAQFRAVIDKPNTPVYPKRSIEHMPDAWEYDQFPLRRFLHLSRYFTPSADHIDNQDGRITLTRSLAFPDMVQEGYNFFLSEQLKRDGGIQDKVYKVFPTTRKQI